MMSLFGGALRGITHIHLHVRAHCTPPPCSIGLIALCAQLLRIILYFEKIHNTIMYHIQAENQDFSKFGIFDILRFFLDKLIMRGTYTHKEGFLLYQNLFVYKAPKSKQTRRFEEVNLKYLNLNTGRSHSSRMLWQRGIPR